MIGTRLGRARHRHVGVAHRLDLLHPHALREIVEHREDLVEDRHQRRRSDAFGVLGERDEVGEHHRHLFVAVGQELDAGFGPARLQPLDDRGGQGVVQQLVGADARGIQLPLAQEQQARGPSSP